MLKTISPIILLLLVHALLGQSSIFKEINQYSQQDSLRGSITPERVWWDLMHYDLFVSVDIPNKSISGTNTITYKPVGKVTKMQIDLQEPMKITKVEQDGQNIPFTRLGSVFYLELAGANEKGQEYKVKIYFEGIPKDAPNAPWDGGFSWKKDDNGNPFVATSNQGIGASLWWPCKDHMYDEPDNGIILSIEVPKDLIAVGNGRLVKTKKSGKNKIYTWKVVNPINNYGININIADYANFSEVYQGEKGPLDMDYWVLSYNLEKAKKHFIDARRTVEAFEHWFGPYPFYEDSYKLVETPYLGMEHQSSVTYGNNYQKGYKGRDLSQTGWGLKWDYIIIHESGHEWFANNITYKDMADMWIHESFTMYSESLFIEYYYGKEAASEYTRGVRLFIANENPLIGDYDVNNSGSKDMYNKGNNLLHTLRQIVKDDEKWRATLRGLNKEFYHQTVTTAQIENYIAKSTGLNLEGFFDQYLRDSRIPTLEYAVINKQLVYRWRNCVANFAMPVKVYLGEEELWLTPTAKFQYAPLEKAFEGLKADPNFYIYTSNTMGDGNSISLD
ncbi:MAG: aminopeptidase N [Cyclobacteriaceae bacterium]|jgi:aminopeptidase N